MDVNRINHLLVDCLGKTDDDQNPLPGSEVVDVWMLIALNTDKVRAHAAEMLELLKEWPRESWGVRVPPLGEDIDYITMGAVLDSQQMAFVLFTFGKLLGWWTILDPRTLGLTRGDNYAQQLAGMGMISISGFHPTVTA